MASEHLTDEWDEHEAGNPECGECWAGYPIAHECGGLTHAKWGDYLSTGEDESYYLEYRCDKCGSDEHDD